MSFVSLPEADVQHRLGNPNQYPVNGPSYDLEKLSGQRPSPSFGLVPLLHTRRQKIGPNFPPCGQCALSVQPAEKASPASRSHQIHKELSQSFWAAQTTSRAFLRLYPHVSAVRAVNSLRPIPASICLIAHSWRCFFSLAVTLLRVMAS